MLPAALCTTHHLNTNRMRAWIACRQPQSRAGEGVGARSITCSRAWHRRGARAMAPGRYLALPSEVELVARCSASPPPDARAWRRSTWRPPAVAPARVFALCSSEAHGRRRRSAEAALAVTAQSPRCAAGTPGRAYSASAAVLRAPPGFPSAVLRGGGARRRASDGDAVAQVHLMAIEHEEPNTRGRSISRRCQIGARASDRGRRAPMAAMPAGLERDADLMDTFVLTSWAADVPARCHFERGVQRWRRCAAAGADRDEAEARAHGRNWHASVVSEFVAGARATEGSAPRRRRVSALCAELGVAHVQLPAAAGGGGGGGGGMRGAASDRA